MNMPHDLNMRKMIITSRKILTSVNMRTRTSFCLKLKKITRELKDSERRRKSMRNLGNVGSLKINISELREVKALSSKQGDEIAILTNELLPSIVEPNHGVDVSSLALVLHDPRKTPMIDTTNYNNLVDHVIHATLIEISKVHVQRTTTSPPQHTTLPKVTPLLNGPLQQHLVYWKGFPNTFQDSDGYAYQGYSFSISLFGKGFQMEAIC
ncbi:hypothetical protein K1719_012827 [Acacia pycnantha]|nr:hypothetical protein K1719_012827 [Acacia pycnantha]